LWKAEFCFGKELMGGVGTAHPTQSGLPLPSNPVRYLVHTPFPCFHVKMLTIIPILTWILQGVSQFIPNIYVLNGRVVGSQRREHRRTRDLQDKNLRDEIGNKITQFLYIIYHHLYPNFRHRYVNINSSLAAKMQRHHLKQSIRPEKRDNKSKRELEE
jgi:hypothetical protein